MDFTERRAARMQYLEESLNAARFTPVYPHVLEYPGFRLAVVTQDCRTVYDAADAAQIATTSHPHAHLLAAYAPLTKHAQTMQFTRFLHRTMQGEAMATAMQAYHAYCTELDLQRLAQQYGEEGDRLDHLHTIVFGELFETQFGLMRAQTTAIEYAHETGLGYVNSKGFLADAEHASRWVLNATSAIGSQPHSFAYGALTEDGVETKIKVGAWNNWRIIEIAATSPQLDERLLQARISIDPAVHDEDEGRFYTRFGSFRYTSAKPTGITIDACTNDPDAVSSMGLLLSRLLA